MGNLLFSVRIVLPIFLIGALGFVLKKIGFLEEAFIKGISKFLFSVSIPCMLLNSLSGSSLKDLNQPIPILFICLFLLLTTALSVFLTARTIKDRSVAASMAQGMARYAAIVQAVPLLTIMYGSGSLKTAAVMLPFAVFLDSILAILIFLYLTPRHSDGEHPLKTSAVTIVRTPIMQASILGVIFLLLGWKLPSPLQHAVSSLGNTVAPLAMIMLGAQFHPAALKKGLRYSLPTAAVHLILYPGIAIVIAILLGVRGEALATMFLFTSVTNPPSSPVIAGNMGGSQEIATQCMVMNLTVSVFTIILGLSVLKSLEFL